MLKILTKSFLLILGIFILSCSNNKHSGAAWPERGIDSFMRQCGRTIGPWVDSDRVEPICECVLQKMMEKYPDSNKVKKMTKEEVSNESMRIAPGCFFMH